jgi:hypothetical protein
MGEKCSMVGARPRREFLASIHNLASIFNYYGFILAG